MRIMRSFPVGQTFLSAETGGRGAPDAAAMRHIPTKIAHQPNSALTQAATTACITKPAHINMRIIAPARSFTESAKVRFTCQRTSLAASAVEETSANYT